MIFALQKNAIRNQVILLVMLWVAMQVLLFRQFGIVTNLEAAKYLAQADYFLQHGHYETGNFIFYSTEILLIAACKKMGIDYWLIVAVQILVNSISAICFYRLVKRFTAKTAVAFWFTAALIIMFYYQLYNVYLFTESLYFSFSIIYFFGLVKLKRFFSIGLLPILGGLMVLYFTRPVGLFFIPATFLFVVLKFFSKKALLIFSTAGVVIVLAFIFLLNSSLNSGGELDFLLPYLDERIICGVPTIRTPHNISVPVEQDSVQGLFYIITHHWKLFLTLSLKRVLAFFGVLRSYYSLGHNVFIGLYFYTMYALIVLGVRKWNKAAKPQIVFILAMVFFTALTTALSCDEWHNRFILAILPFLLLLASLLFSQPSKTVIDDNRHVA